MRLTAADCSPNELCNASKPVQFAVLLEVALCGPVQCWIVQCPKLVLIAFQIKYLSTGAVCI